MYVHIYVSESHSSLSSQENARRCGLLIEIASYIFGPVKLKAKKRLNYLK